MADPLSLTASLIAVTQVTGKIITVCYEYLQAAKSARKEAAKIVLEVQTLRNVFEHVLQLVTTDNPANDTLLPALVSMTTKGGVIAQCLNDLVELNERLQEPRTKWKMLGNQLSWPLRKAEVDKQVESIHRLTNIIELGIVTDTAASILEIQQNTRDLKDRILDFQRPLDISPQQQLQVMLEWLDAHDPSDQHNSIKRVRISGTGSWLLNNKGFESWYENTGSSSLWIHGIPGCGKTVLTSLVIDHIRQSIVARESNVTLAYYYFNFNNQSTSTVDAMLRSLVAQLSSWKGDPPSALKSCAYDLFATTRYHHNGLALYREGIAQPSTADLVGMLTGILRELDQVYLVLDGLDECSDEPELIEVLGDILSLNVNGLHVFLSSRHNQEIRNALELSILYEVEVKTKVVEEDIVQYIRHQLSTHPKLKRWITRFGVKIEDALTQGSQGMFRWVVCQVERLTTCITPRDLDKALRTLPNSLSDTYTLALSTIDPSCWNYAIVILMWLATSPTPLETREVMDTCTIDFEAGGDPLFCEDLRLEDINDILKSCASLVTIVRTPRRRNGTTTEVTELHLAHYTVKDYLLSDIFKATLPHAIPFAGKEDIHCFIAKSAVAYLLALKQPLTPELQADRPLSRHAAEFWIYHYLKAKNDPILKALAIELLKSSEVEPYNNWCRLFNPVTPWRAPDLGQTDFPPPLYYASCRGIDTLVKALLDSGADPNGAGKEHRSCLQVAAYNGHATTVAHLFEAGADPNQGGGLYDNPLKAATVAGHNAIISLLLKFGAHTDKGNILHSFGGTPLLEACRRNNVAAVELLIKAGADPNHYSRKGNDVSPLVAAVTRTHLECIRLLLPTCSQATAVRGLSCASGDGKAYLELLHIFVGYVPQVVLHYASAGGYEQLVSDILTLAVPDETVRGSSGSRLSAGEFSRATALVSASREGHLAIVEQLLAEGVDVNTVTDCGSALSAAAHGGHGDVVQLLIANGASFTEAGGIYGGPVQAAVSGNHLEIVKLLISAGADINARAVVKRQTSARPVSSSPLLAACQQSNTVLVDWLLAHGADVDFCESRDLMGATGPALVTCSEKGHLEMVDRLLRAGADVNLCGRTGRFASVASPLYIACEKEHVDVAKRLLDAGAKMCFEDAEDGSSHALLGAVRGGSLSVVNMLLQAGADPDARRVSKEYGELTALSQACMGENLDIVVSLLNAGANVHKYSHLDEHHEPPIHTASRLGTAEIVRVLGQHGANPDEQVQEGWTALHKAARRGCADIVKVLVKDLQANTSLAIINGSKSTHTAAQWNKFECLRILMESGLDLNAPNESGKTPLHWAVEGQAVQTVQWLLENGGDRSIKEHTTDMTPGDYAMVMLEKAPSWSRDAEEEIAKLLRS